MGELIYGLHQAKLKDDPIRYRKYLDNKNKFNNSPKAKESARRWKQKNKDEIKLTRKIWKKNLTKEQQKKWLSQSKEWRKKNIERVKLLNKNWRLNLTELQKKDLRTKKNEYIKKRKKTETVATPEYLYDAVINNNGIILTNTDARYTHRVNDRKMLPLSNVTEGVTISADQFRDQTLAVYKLNEETCRHYILVKDQSGNDKNHYKKTLSAITEMNSKVTYWLIK